jgi:hypothetical protein
LNLDHSPVKSFVIKLLLVGTSVLLSLGLAEVICRALGLWAIPASPPNWYRPSNLPGVPYLMQPDLRIRWGLGEVRTNQDGLRDERMPAANPNVTRVLALGDSVTFGMGVDQKDTFPAWLERIANSAGQTGKPLEVINAGVSGYNLADEANYLPFLLDRYRPDLVIWLMIPNDYDDSLAAGKNGELTWAISDYVVSNAFLSSWGSDNSAPIHIDDFRYNMTPASLAWAEGKLHEVGTPRKLWNWLKGHLYLAAMIDQSVMKLAHDNRSAAPTGDAAQVSYFPLYQSDVGEFEVAKFAALYFSESALEQGRKTIERTRQLLDAKGIPLVLLNTALPLPKSLMQNSRRYHYYDMTSLLGESFPAFAQTNNLGWDPHLNQSGNKRFAQAVLNGLSCSGFHFANPQAAPCESIKLWQQRMGQAWDWYAREKLAYAAKLRTSIDFTNYAGIHQIIGGVLPPRTFPGDGQAKRANFILRKPQGNLLEMRVKPLGADPCPFELEVKAGQDSLKKAMVFDNQHPSQRIDIGELKKRQTASDVLEIVLRCPETGKCNKVKLDYLGEPT